MFTEPNSWAGGYFELDLELGPRDDRRLRDALSVLWAHPNLCGCFLQADREPSLQTRVDPGSQPLGNRLHGVATITTGCEVACCSFAVRLDDGVDWLYFAIPMGSLTTAFAAGAYPIQDGTHPRWVEPVSEWLRGVGESVHRSVPFQLGLIGWEADSEDLDSQQIARDGVPSERWIGYLLPESGALRWSPPNILKAPLSIDREL